MPEGDNGLKERIAGVARKRTEGNSEDENPISAGELAAETDSKETDSRSPGMADAVMWIFPVPELRKYVEGCGSGEVFSD